MGLPCRTHPLVCPTATVLHAGNLLTAMFPESNAELTNSPTSLSGLQVLAVAAMRDTQQLSCLTVCLPEKLESAAASRSPSCASPAMGDSESRATVTPSSDPESKLVACT